MWDLDTPDLRFPMPRAGSCDSPSSPVPVSASTETGLDRYPHHGPIPCHPEITCCGCPTLPLLSSLHINPDGSARDRYPPTWPVLPQKNTRTFPARRSGAKTDPHHRLVAATGYCSRATGINRSFKNSITRGSEKTSARPVTPLFHVHPRGWPFIAQMNSGFSSRAAFCRPSHSPPIQGISVHRSFWGRQASNNASNVSSVNAGAGICYLFGCHNTPPYLF